MWNGYPDFWQDYEHREIIETVWKNYEDNVGDLVELLKQINNSKSIMTIPRQLKRTWMLLRWDSNESHTPYVLKEKLLDIPQLVDQEYEPVDIEYTLDPETGEIDIDLDDPLLDALKEEKPGDHWTLRLWAPVYYVVNPAVENFYAPLLNMPEFEQALKNSDIYPWTDTYYRIIRALWYVFVNGPTMENISLGLFILYDIPFALQRGTIIKNEENPETHRIVVELQLKDMDVVNSWEFSNNLVCPFQVGDEVEGNTPLVIGGVEVDDYISYPNWWTWFSPADAKDRIEVIEKYSTYLIRVDGPSFYGDTRINEAAFDVYETFVNRVSPSFAKTILSLAQSWVDIINVDMISELTTLQDMTLYRQDSVHPDAEAVRVRAFSNNIPLVLETSCVGGIVSVPFGASIVGVSNESLNVVEYRSGELFVTLGGSPYTGSITIYYDLLFFHPDVERWTESKNVHAGSVFNWQSFTYVIQGTDVVDVEEIQVNGEVFTNYTVSYNRTNLGEGELTITFGEAVQHFTYTVIRVPYVARLDGEGYSFRDYTEDKHQLKGVYDPSTYPKKHPWPSNVKYPSNLMHPANPRDYEEFLAVPMDVSRTMEITTPFMWYDFEDATRVDTTTLSFEGHAGYVESLVVAMESSEEHKLWSDWVEEIPAVEDSMELEGHYDPETYWINHPHPSIIKRPSNLMKPSSAA